MKDKRENVVGRAPGQILRSRTDFPPDRQILLSHTSPKASRKPSFVEDKYKDRGFDKDNDKETKTNFLSGKGKSVRSGDQNFDNQSEKCFEGPSS